eukprot:TRINITY_DN2597_c0_g1_i2.p4 TRINITY_DN2597_c0_g1~~TRINITY_DN2597_c0_g1_i2.p4  ORF type:complete len:151 (+),score=12.21 TRINITY_DN2597_c0_g1_i2:62-514(+)
MLSGVSNKNFKVVVASCQTIFNRPAKIQCHRTGGYFSVLNATESGANGGNVLDKPATLLKFHDKSNISSRKPPIYRVLLHNDDVNRREYVVRALLRVVDGIGPDDAVNIMNEAHVSGIALVVSCAVGDASRYCHGLRNNGLISTIEPDFL